MRWPERIDPKRLEGYRKRLRKEIPKYAGHRVYFRGQDEISDSSKQFVAFELRGPDPDKLQDIGEVAIGLLSRVPGLEDVTPRSPTA